MSSKTPEEKLVIAEKWRLSNKEKHDTRIEQMKNTVKNRTEEQKAQISANLSRALTGKPRLKYTCPKCGCSGDIGMMKRWGHDETCKRDAANFRGKQK